MDTAGNIISGDRIKHLKAGWALFPFIGNRAHYWIEDTQTMPPEIRDGGRVRYYTSKCNLAGVTTGRIPALAPGNWPKCKRCAKKVKA